MTASCEVGWLARETAEVTWGRAEAHRRTPGTLAACVAGPVARLVPHTDRAACRASG